MQARSSTKPHAVTKRNRRDRKIKNGNTSSITSIVAVAKVRKLSGSYFAYHANGVGKGC
jgi:hypothetical protein